LGAVGIHNQRFQYVSCRRPNGLRTRG
jgi:hypothetical protein